MDPNAASPEADIESGDEVIGGPESKDGTVVDHAMVLRPVSLNAYPERFSAAKPACKKPD